MDCLPYLVNALAPIISVPFLTKTEGEIRSRLFVRDRTRLLTIKKVCRESATNDRGKQNPVVIYFNECKAKELMLPDAVSGKMSKSQIPEKKLWCNITNGRTIAHLYGNVENWIGKKITLYPTVDGRNKKDCIRVRPEVPKEKRQDGGENA